jgi:hypothetical protein
MKRVNRTGRGRRKIDGGGVGILELIELQFVSADSEQLGACRARASSTLSILLRCDNNW